MLIIEQKQYFLSSNKWGTYYLRENRRVIEQVPVSLNRLEEISPAE